MQIIDNKALMLRVRSPEKITSLIPCSKQIGDHEVLVRWGLEEAQVLKNLRVKGVPSPIRAKYNWPGMHRPFQHQITTAEFLTLYRRAFCFNAQGTGILKNENVEYDKQTIVQIVNAYYPDLRMQTMYYSGQ